MARRQRTVFPTYDIARLWMRQELEYATNGRDFYFRGKVIYSYGEHFWVAMFVTRGRRTCIFYNGDNYSATTCKHQKEVRCALGRWWHGPVFHVSNFGSKWGAGPDTEAHKANVEDYKVAIHLAEKSLARSTYKRMTQKESHLKGLVEEARAYCKFFGIRRTFKLRTVDELKEARRKELAKFREECRRNEIRKLMDDKASLKAELAQKVSEAISYQHRIAEAMSAKNQVITDLERETELLKAEIDRLSGISVRVSPRIIPTAGSGRSFRNKEIIDGSEHSGFSLTFESAPGGFDTAGAEAPGAGAESTGDGAAAGGQESGSAASDLPLMVEQCEGDPEAGTSAEQTRYRYRYQYIRIPPEPRCRTARTAIGIWWREGWMFRLWRLEDRGRNTVSCSPTGSC